MSDEWVMVPREPTEAMFSASSFQEWDTFEQEWRAMLDAAPAAPAGHDFIAHEYRKGFIDGQISMREQLSPAAPQQAEPVAWAVFDPSGEVVYAALSETRCIEYRDNEYRYGHSAAKNWTIRPVFAHPPAAEVQQAEPSGDDLSVEFKRGWDAALATAPKQAEPVAWIGINPRSGHTELGESKSAPSVMRDFGMRPLYLHPPAAEVQRLRDAATRLVALWNPARPESASVVADAIDKLRRVLEGE